MTRNEAKERLWKLHWLAMLEKNGVPPEYHAEAREIAEEVTRLDARSQAVILLRYCQRMTFKRIAEQMHYSVKQVRRIHDKALEKYIKQLKGEDENV